MNIDYPLLQSLRDLEDLKIANLELAHDLEKTQKLLSIQENIKAEYKLMLDSHKKEIDQVSDWLLSQMPSHKSFVLSICLQLKKDYDLQLTDQARLLDIKTDKIRKLEHQLNGVLYRRPKDLKDIEPHYEDIDLADLGPDENALEIQILGIILNGAHLPADVEVFVSFDFYEHEPAVTPVYGGLKISPDFTARLVLKVDDFFFNYLKNQNIQIIFFYTS
jgi:hypothetical protein